MKKRHLVSYDYGQGAVWACVLARSSEEITERFPELRVVTEIPDWMSDSFREQMETTAVDIDHPDEGLLGDILADRDVGE